MIIASPIIVTHSWESSAPIGWMALNSGISFSRSGKVAAAMAMRGSVVKVSARGGGEGNMTSHVSGARLAGSWARMSWRIVVPVRGMPMMKTGFTISWPAMAGSVLRSST